MEIIRKSLLCAARKNVSYRNLCSNHRKVLGIETSCDDTGAAVVDEFGNILGEKKISQTNIHIRNGGIIPPIARNLHQQNIQEVVSTALQQSGCKLEELSGIAATVRPGMPLSLLVGMQHAKDLVCRSGRPFLPIHHMEAHALTVRMVHPVEFPFTVLLASGGHCQLAFVKSVTDFRLLGRCLDNAPGETLDKFARRLKLKNLPEFAGMCGGQAVETLASRGGNQLAYEYPVTMSQAINCNFSFSGLLFCGIQHIQATERKLGILGSELLPDLEDMCASFLYAMTRQMVKRVQRGLTFLNRKEMAPTDSAHRTLVLAGGVASNRYIKAALTELAQQMDYQFFAPPPHLCTDNGTMVAWNGIERLKVGAGIEDPDKVDIEPKAPLGTDMTEEVSRMNISGRELRWLKLDLFKPNVVDYSQLGSPVEALREDIIQ